MADVMKLLNDERKLLQKRLSSLEQAIEALGGDVATEVKRTVKTGKKMSEETKKKLSKAAKARWAAAKKATS